MTYRGEYDPTGFNQLDVGTWPPVPVDESGYLPGDWWYITAPGSINGDPVDVGDRVYSIGRGRLFGELEYGDDVFGGPVDPPPWSPDVLRVGWLAVAFTQPPWDRPVPPYAGCPLIGEWRIVVEVLAAVDDGVRTYGSGTYGSDVYGDIYGRGLGWLDITSNAYGIVARRSGDGGPIVDVDEIALDLVDFDASLIPMSVPRVENEPGVGTMLRVSLLDPQSEPHSLFVGRIESMVDVHDTERRTLAIDAYGLATDFVVSAPSWERPQETTSTRLAALFQLVEWEWGTPSIEPDWYDHLQRPAIEQSIVARDEIDQVAISGGLTFDTDRRGVPRFVRWPLEPDQTMEPIVVVDAKRLDGIASPSLDFVADTAQLLNVAEVSSVDEGVIPATVVVRRDEASIALVRMRSQTFGFPLTDLYSYGQRCEQTADAALERFSRTTTRIDTFEIDTTVDKRWLPIAATIDRGQRLEVSRTQPRPLTLDALVVGYELRFVRGRVTGTVYCSTLTPTI